MADVVFILVTVAFFAVCVLYVRACDRIVTATEDATESPEAGR